MRWLCRIRQILRGRFAVASARVAVGFLPLLFLLLLDARLESKLAGQTVYLFTLVNLIGVIAKGGQEVWINANLRVSVRDIPWREFRISMLRVIAITAVLVAAFSLGAKQFPTLVPMNSVDFENLLGLAIASFGIAASWVIVALFQARGHPVVGLLSVWGPYYVVLSAGVAVFGCLNEPGDFMLISGAASLISIIAAWIMSLTGHPLDFDAGCSSEKSVDAERSTLAFTTSLWASSALGHGAQWLVQIAGLSVVGIASQSDFALMWRYSSVATTGLVVVIFFAQKMFPVSMYTPNGSAQIPATFAKMQLTAVGLGLLSAVPLVLLDCLTADLGWTVVLVSVLAGCIRVAAGPCYILLNALEESRVAVKIKIAGLAAVIGICVAYHQLSLADHIIWFCLLLSFSQGLERLVARGVALRRLVQV